MIGFRGDRSAEPKVAYARGTSRWRPTAKTYTIHRICRAVKVFTNRTATIDRKPKLTGVAYALRAESHEAFSLAQWHREIGL